jgi:hypothetical protein
MDPEAVKPKRPRRLDRQSGQAVLMGVLAILLLMVSVAAGLNYIGPRATLGRHQAGPYQFIVVQKALQAFVAKNGRLPCPANGASPSLGTEDCTITNSKGVVPWKSIGITQTDAIDRYQSQIGYAVTEVESQASLMGGKTFLNQSSSYWNSEDALQVETCVTTCGTPTKYAYVLISFGSDRAGAYLQSGTRYAVPASGTDQHPNTLDSAFLGAPGNTAFEIWPYRSDSSAGNSYFDDVMAYETGAQLSVDIGTSKPNDQTPGDQSHDLGSSNGNSKLNNNPNAPAYAAQNSDAGAMSAANGTINNTYSCGAGSTFCPGSTNSGSLANTYAFAGSNCSTNDCTALGNGECLNLVGNLGTVCVHDPVYGTGIFVGNGGLNGDWVGPNHANSCPQCSVPGTVNYMIPTQTLTYDLTSSYKSWAFVDYLVDGGQQVQVDGYQAAAWQVTGDVTGGSSIIANVSPTTNIKVGQSIVNSTHFPNYTVITGINGSQVTVSVGASGSATGASLIAMDSGFNLAGDVTAGSSEIDNIAIQANSPVTITTLMSALAVGDTVSGPGIPVGTTITAVSSAGLSMTVSSAAFATESSDKLFAAPWVKIGTSIISNGLDTNVLSGAQIAGITTSGSLSMTNVAPTAGLAAGQMIAGAGIQPGTIIEALATDASGTTVVLSQAATTSNTGYFLVATNDLITSPVIGDLTSGSSTIANVSSTIGITSGQAISGVGIPSGTTVTAVTSNSLTMSQSANATGASVRLFFTTRVPVTGITANFTSFPDRRSPLRRALVSRRRINGQPDVWIDIGHFGLLDLRPAARRSHRRHRLAVGDLYHQHRLGHPAHRVASGDGNQRRRQSGGDQRHPADRHGRRSNRWIALRRQCLAGHRAVRRRIHHQHQSAGRHRHHHRDKRCVVDVPGGDRHTAKRRARGRQSPSGDLDLHDRHIDRRLNQRDRHARLGAAGVGRVGLGAGHSGGNSEHRAGGYDDDAVAERDPVPVQLDPLQLPDVPRATDLIGRAVRAAQRRAGGHHTVGAHRPAPVGRDRRIDPVADLATARNEWLRNELGRLESQWLERKLYRSARQPIRQSPVHRRVRQPDQVQRSRAPGAALRLQQRQELHDQRRRQHLQLRHVVRGRQGLLHRRLQCALHHAGRRRMVEPAGAGHHGLRTIRPMRRFHALCALVAAGLSVPATLRAAPPDLATICATLFMSKAQSLATSNGVVHPLQWYRMSMTQTQVTLDLVISLTATSAVRYSGFKCQQASDGTVTMVSSPK